MGKPVSPSRLPLLPAAIRPDRPFAFVALSWGRFWPERAIRTGGRMSEPVWTKFLTERDRAVFEASGYGTRGGFGKRPALVIIDVNWAFCGDKPEPILESIKRWRNSCGEDAWTALPYIRSLIDKCHEKGVPVIYTTGIRRDDNWDGGSWLWKNSRGKEDRQTIVSNLDGNEIV